ncbi:hypothetical protein [Sphingobium sp. MK2]|uniref:hypothetical protein n=1 Tax=Sphingobium sp. MK2 TaxID=3116540 RepID=UPI0004AE297B
MLCVVLALAFAAASATSVVDRIQHQPGAPTNHQHMLFTDISFDADDHHVGHSDASDRDDGADPDHQPGTGHHHHGDSGSGLPAFASGDNGLPDLRSDRRSLTPARPVIGVTIHGPERPPKSITASV